MHKHQYTFYIYKNSKKDRLICWHGETYYIYNDGKYKHKTSKNPVLQVENLQAKNQASGISCLAVTVSFVKPPKNLQEELLKAGVTKELCKKALAYLDEKETFIKNNLHLFKS